MKVLMHAMYKPGFLAPALVWRCGWCRKVALTHRGALRLEGKPCAVRTASQGPLSREIADIHILAQLLNRDVLPPPPNQTLSEYIAELRMQQGDLK